MEVLLPWESEAATPDIEAAISALLVPARAAIDCQSISVCRGDGFCVSHYFVRRGEAPMTAQVAAFLIRAVSTAAHEMKVGDVGHIVVETDTVKIVVMAVGSDSILVATFRPDGNTGMALLGMRRIATQVAEVLAHA